MPLEDQDLAKRYQQTMELVENFAIKYQREIASINVIAVSKRHPPEKVVNLVKLGHRQFAENYLQEGAEKVQQVSNSLENQGIETKICWHFIGHIQSRKCREIAALFDWVHTIDSRKVAEKLNQYRTGLDPLNVLIQLNLQQESSKSGVSIHQLPELAVIIDELPNLNFRGLMIIPKAESEFDKQRTVFKQCRETLEQLNQKGYDLDHLSMGMTEDMQAAIAEGATQVRVGTAIFGPRPT